MEAVQNRKKSLCFLHSWPPAIKIWSRCIVAGCLQANYSRYFRVLQLTCNSINHICFHHKLLKSQDALWSTILHTSLLPLSKMSSVIEYTWGRKKFNLYWFKCMACQNKFSLQLTLNFVIIPERCVLEAAPVIIWKLFSLHLDYMHASLWINRSIVSF